MSVSAQQSWLRSSTVLVHGEPAAAWSMVDYRMGQWWGESLQGRQSFGPRGLRFMEGMRFAHEREGAHQLWAHRRPTPVWRNAFRGRLVACFRPNQARRVQHASVWMPGSTSGPGRLAAKAISEPGSQDANFFFVSTETGRGGAGEARGGLCLD